MDRRHAHDKRGRSVLGGQNQGRQLDAKLVHGSGGREVRQQLTFAGGCPPLRAGWPRHAITHKSACRFSIPLGFTSCQRETWAIAGPWREGREGEQGSRLCHRVRRSAAPAARPPARRLPEYQPCLLLSRCEQTRTDSVVSKAGHFCATRCCESSPRPVLEEAGA